MHRPRLWLYFLLALSLIGNGATAAYAASSMALVHATTAAASPTMHAAPSHLVADRTSAPCHDTPASAHSGAAGDDAMAKAPDHGGAPDCCKSGGCYCECVHQSQATTAMGLVIASAVVHANSMRALKPAHAQAPLPHLMRPPIV